MRLGSLCRLGNEIDAIAARECDRERPLDAQIEHASPRLKLYGVAEAGKRNKASQFMESVGAASQNL